MHHRRNKRKNLLHVVPEQCVAGGMYKRLLLVVIGSFFCVVIFIAVILTRKWALFGCHFSSSLSRKIKYYLTVRLALQSIMQEPPNKVPCCHLFRIMSLKCNTYHACIHVLNVA